MSAVELLKKVKALPVRERQKLVQAILALAVDVPPPPGKKTRPVKWPDIEARARRIFGNRVLPNLVLSEREETSS